MAGRRIFIVASLISQSNRLKTSSLLRYSRMELSSQNATEQLSLATSSALQKHVQCLLDEHQRITGRLNASVTDGDGEGASLRLAELMPVVECHRRIKDRLREMEELNKLIKDSSITDIELLTMAKEDVSVCQRSVFELENELLRLLTPAEPYDNHAIIVEVTAGVGGLEAMLFAKKLFEMYQSYASFKGWEIQILEYQMSDLDGLRHGSISVEGLGAYSSLKFEGGVHRVQRVPQTEKSGRIHTSTVTVAIMPQPTEIQVNINTKDLKVETKRASGPGGQHVNKTDSAVRIVHLLSGLAVESQSERSQIENKSIAMCRLRAKLYLRQYEESIEKLQATRRIQVGTSGRSEKIRTYNFIQDRITDHRLAKNIYGVDNYLSGGEDLDRVIEQLICESHREILLEIIGNNI